MIKGKAAEGLRPGGYQPSVIALVRGAGVRDRCEFQL
jgi:hypothetical protein